MDLLFRREVAAGFHGPTQKIKNLSEQWFAEEGYCPACGEENVRPYPNNRPVADFVCPTCGEEFELKSQARVFRDKVADGAYGR